MNDFRYPRQRGLEEVTNSKQGFVCVENKGADNNKQCICKQHLFYKLNSSVARWRSFLLLFTPIFHEIATP